MSSRFEFTDITVAIVVGVWVADIAVRKRKLESGTIDRRVNYYVDR